MLDSASAVHTSLHDSSQFNINYGQNIIEKIDLTRGYAGFHAHIKSGANAYFTASHLDARYRLVQFHGHWNIDPTERGSEHIIDGTFYPAEFHFVHIREDFTTLPEAVVEKGESVIAVFLQLSDTDNPALEPLINAILQFHDDNPLVIEGEADPEKNPEIFEQNPAMLFPTDRNYLAYTGSLTTPAYQTCVAWNVLIRPITISRSQLDVLALLIPKNFRSTIAIDTRTTVYTSDVRSNRRPIFEEEEQRSEKELENHPLEPTPHFVQTENEEVEGVEEIELAQDELAFLHRLRQKYSGKNSQLRSELLEWKI